MSDATVLNYGGGRQTVAICILIAKGVMPRPDRIVMADTGRENPMTFDYLEKFVRPFMDHHGSPVEVAGREWATLDLYANNGDLLLPVFTKDGKLPAFCSGHWKADVVERYLKSKGIRGGTKLIGFSFDERRRWSRAMDKTRHKWKTACPLVDLMLTTQDCQTIITRQGWPMPYRSSCWMCPHKDNREWAYIRDNHPERFEEACRMDEEVRENDERGGVWLHHSRVPLREADLTIEEAPEVVRQCSLGMCFV